MCVCVSPPFALRPDRSFLPPHHKNKKTKHLQMVNMGVMATITQSIDADTAIKVHTHARLVYIYIYVHSMFMKGISIMWVDLIYFLGRQTCNPNPQPTTTKPKTINPRPTNQQSIITTTNKKHTLIRWRRRSARRCPGSKRTRRTRTGRRRSPC